MTFSPLPLPGPSPERLAEMRLAQAQETVLAAALAYDDAENDPMNGHTARAAYWGAYTTALGSYANTHGELFGTAREVVPVSDDDEPQNANTERLLLLSTLAVQAAARAGAAPTAGARLHAKLALENMYEYIHRIHNGLPAAVNVSRETTKPAAVEPCELEYAGDLGRAFCLSHDKTIEQGLKCPVGGVEA